MHLATHSAESVPLRLRNITDRKWTLVGHVVKPLAATALLALCAHISFPVPFTPIPVTMQTFGVLLIGLLLSPTTAAAALLLYLAEGAVGLPVLSPHGVGGMAQILGPSAGYLLSYPFAALLSGRLFVRFRDSLATPIACAAACVMADILILLSGSAWLMIVLHLSPSRALDVGTLPFLAGEMIKVLFLVLTVGSFQRAREIR